MFKAGRLAALPWKALVVIQFTASVSLIIATMMVFKQINYAKSRPVGYNYDALVSIPLRSKEIKEHWRPLKKK